MLPLIGLGLVGYGLKKMFSDDYDDDYSSPSSNRREAEEEYKEDQREIIQNDINTYIDNQIDHIKLKYNAKISINSTVSELSSMPGMEDFISQLSNFNNLNISSDPTVEVISKDYTLSNKIKEIKNENVNIQNIINDLEKVKNAI